LTWELNNDGTSGWSNANCQTPVIVGSYVTCKCSKLGEVSALMLPATTEPAKASGHSLGLLPLLILLIAMLYQWLNKWVFICIQKSIDL